MSFLKSLTLPNGIKYNVPIANMTTIQFNESYTHNKATELSDFKTSAPLLTYDNNTTGTFSSSVYFSKAFPHFYTIEGTIIQGEIINICGINKDSNSHIDVYAIATTSDSNTKTLWVSLYTLNETLKQNEEISREIVTNFFGTGIQNEIDTTITPTRDTPMKTLPRPLLYLAGTSTPPDNLPDGTLYIQYSQAEIREGALT